MFAWLRAMKGPLRDGVRVATSIENVGSPRQTAAPTGLIPIYFQEETASEITS